METATTTTTRTRRRSGPKTVYTRELTETMRVSPLAKRILAAGAERCGVSVGDFEEALVRKCGPHVTRADFPALDPCRSTDETEHEARA